MAFLTLSFAELFHAFNVRSGNGSAFAGILSNKVLLGTVALGIGINVALCFSPLAVAFGISALPAGLWGIIFGGALSVILFGEIYKLIFNLLVRGRRAAAINGGKKPAKTRGKRAAKTFN